MGFSALDLQQENATRVVRIYTGTVIADDSAGRRSNKT
jgi:hypothetical protein